MSPKILFERGICSLCIFRTGPPKRFMLNHMHTPQQKNQHLPHPFQSAQLLLNQHCQKARQRYNKLAPLTICWSCCSIVCLFKTRARTHTHAQISQAGSLLPSSKLEIRLREASKGSGLNPYRATVTPLELCLGFALSLQTKQKHAHTVPAWKTKVSKSLFQHLTGKVSLRKRKGHGLARTQH